MSFYSDQAQEFTQMASDLQTRLESEGASMSLADYNSLDARCEDLQEKAESMNATDLQQTLEGLQIDTGKLKDTTDRLGAAVKTIQETDKLIAIATSAVTLAAAIVTADPVQIVQGVSCAVKALAEKDAPATSAGGVSLAASAGTDEDSSTGN